MRLGAFTVSTAGGSFRVFGPVRTNGSTVWFCDPWNRAQFLARYPECADRAKDWPLTRMLLWSRQHKPSLRKLVQWLKDRPEQLAAQSQPAPTPSTGRAAHG